MGHLLARVLGLNLCKGWGHGKGRPTTLYTHYFTFDNKITVFSLGAFWSMIKYHNRTNTFTIRNIIFQRKKKKWYHPESKPPTFSIDSIQRSEKITIPEVYSSWLYCRQVDKETRLVLSVLYTRPRDEGLSWMNGNLLLYVNINMRYVCIVSAVVCVSLVLKCVCGWYILRCEEFMLKCNYS